MSALSFGSTILAMAATSPVRLLLIAVLSTGLQFCCCNVHAMLNTKSCCEGQGRYVPHGITAVDHDHCCTNRHHSSEDGHDRGTQSAHDDENAPNHSSPSNSHDHGSCKCGTHDKATNLIQTSPLSFAAVVVAVLPPSTLIAPSLINNALHYSDLHAVLSPPESLLRRHCALIL